MIREIKIKLVDDCYNVCSDDQLITKVDKTSLTLSGQELYSNLFSKLPLNEEVKIDIQLDDSIVDSNDKRLAADIKTVIDKIIETINVDFNLIKVEEQEIE